MNLAHPRPSQINAWHSNARPLNPERQTYTKAEGIAAEDALAARMAAEGPMKASQGAKAPQTDIRPLYGQILRHLAKHPDTAEGMAAEFQFPIARITGALRSLQNTGEVVGRRPGGRRKDLTKLPMMWALSEKRRAG